MAFLEREQNIVELVVSKVHALFALCPDDAHGFDHAERVAGYAAYIAHHEGKNMFMSTLAGWLHDIGRAIEEYPEQFPTYNAKKTHHELSYELLQQWFREDEQFFIFSDEEKLELLYDLRNHWNDEADKYDSAYILRDADKIDGLGEIGLQRHFAHHEHDTKKEAHLDIRLRYEWIYHFKTKTAKKMCEKQHLIDPIEAERTRLLTADIKPVEL
ncbi:MAG: hypothetical protein COU32_00515 [Candidatus Magasanikbacteria bacterium CG10_big_fil_rev_8_21_14_0_10_42_10]|uniref:HD/PDEase domain-containing protein n=2 Tax=Candidatus Magasanikiibacteriota TaxID=1752731 RepID=A0A2H0TYX5_9BACT|nr:MAG: hypothetical protein COU32_00515 [Candidatus Magasanikbacteria bacterium CG10_big_fil_rev_8_21_14_0_10_42_10]PIZ94767.1 MAG: hypothetical protein COX82_00110 [Candidatus Magasanikbacteria bacterium CG_4_10_14_0_2_um_filter_41_10]